MGNKSVLIILGGVVIACCIVMLCASFIIGACAYKQNRQVSHLEPTTFVIKVDSIGTQSEEVALMTKNLIDRMDKQEHLLVDKYEHILEQKEVFNDVVTFGSMLLAIVLSLLGFFGYKSLNSLEEKVLNQSKTEAKDMAKTFFETEFNTFKTLSIQSIKDELTAKVNNTMEQKNASLEKSMKQSVNDRAKQAAIQYNQRLEVVEGKADNLITSVKSLDEKITSLEARVDGMSASPGTSFVGRRTLSATGKNTPQTNLEKTNNDGK